MKARPGCTGVRLVIFLFFYNRLSKETEFGHLLIDLRRFIIIIIFLMICLPREITRPWCRSKLIISFKCAPPLPPTSLDPSWKSDCHR